MITCHSFRVIAVHASTGKDCTPYNSTTQRVVHYADTIVNHCKQLHLDFVRQVSERLFIIPHLGIIGNPCHEQPTFDRPLPIVAASAAASSRPLSRHTSHLLYVQCEQEQSRCSVFHLLYLMVTVNKHMKDKCERKWAVRHAHT